MRAFAFQRDEPKVLPNNEAIIGQYIRENEASLFFQVHVNKTKYWIFYPLFMICLPALC